MRRIGQEWEQEGRNKCVPQGASRSTNQAAERAFYAGARFVLDTVDDANRGRREMSTAVDNFLDNLAVDVATFEQRDRGRV